MNGPQLIYQYTAGGLFFFITLYLCFRPGANDLDDVSDRRALIYLILGFAGYFIMHSLWIILATGA